MIEDAWKGVVVAESFDDPTIINRFAVERAFITKPFRWTPYKGAQPFTGRWHLYRVRCAEKDLDVFQQHIQPGWYAHFWCGDALIVIFNDRRFAAKLNDRATWADAIAHGRRHDIPGYQLDFKDI